MSQINKALIIGAGPIGLVTAWQLLKNGWDVKIFEKNKIVGGMCRTWKWGDFYLDTGPHIFHTPDKKLAEFFETNFGDLFIKGNFWCKNVTFHNKKEYWDYPLSWESISKYPSSLKSKIIKELDLLDPIKKTTAKNYKEYMDAQVGPTLRKMFFESYPEKIWGIPIDEMIPDWAPKRIKFRNKTTPFYHNQWNAVGKYGTGCIYDRIRDQIIDLGGEIYLEWMVTDLITKNGVLKKLRFQNNQEINIYSNDIVISSLPITHTAKMLGYDSKLKFRGIQSVYLSYDVDRILPEGVHWLYYGSEKVYFNRVTEPKMLSPFVSPKHKTYLTAEITFSKDDIIDKMDSKKMIEHVAHQIEKVGLIKKDKLINGCVNKENFVYPLLYTGYQEELAKTKAIISKYQQIYSLGTGGDYNYADSQILFHKAFDTVSIICGKDSSFTQTIKEVAPSVLNKKVSINKRVIGDEENTYIIAEAGLNHNGSLELAKKLVDSAKNTNCDAIKFQTFLPDSRISSKIKSVNYAETVIGLEERLDEMFARLALSFEDQAKLFEYATKEGVEIFSTPFDFESVDFLDSLGVNAFKIASMDLVNLPLIKYTSEKGKPVLLSTGMSSLGQIDDAVKTVRETGNPNLILLHCNSSYPAAQSEMNLKVINTLKELYNIPVGLSDHTVGLFVAHTAIVLGANLVERHFTLDRNFEGPDHILSSEPKELTDLVKISKLIPIVSGDGIKVIQPNEYDTINSQRKSLHAACDIKKGEPIKKEMIAIKGPGGGLLPKYMDIVIGRKARKKISKDHPINWNNI